jgi:hypothetical protein
MPRSYDKCLYCFHSAYDHGHRDYDNKRFYDGLCVTQNCPCLGFEEKPNESMGEDEVS